MIKKLPLTAEILDIGEDYLAAIACRDECIRSIFKTKKAIYYQKQAAKNLTKFWKLIGELYPQTNVEPWSFSIEDQCLYREVDDDENNS